MEVPTLEIRNLDDIPNELLYIILDLCDYDSKLNISLVNHHFKALVDLRVETEHRKLFSEKIEKPIGSKITELKIAHISNQFYDLVNENDGSKTTTDYLNLGENGFSDRMSIFNIIVEYSNELIFQICSYNVFTDERDKLMKRMGDKSGPNSRLIMLDLQTIFTELLIHITYQVHRRKNPVTKFELEENLYCNYSADRGIIRCNHIHANLSIY